MSEYDKKLEKHVKRNEKFLSEFEVWLNKKRLSPKTIRKHLSNADLYINNYLCYYNFYKMEEGTHEVNMFLSDWFIRKCLWSSVNSVRETAASIKKFYQCMNELGYVSDDDYNFLYTTIKDNMDIYLELMTEYDNICYEDYF